MAVSTPPPPSLPPSPPPLSTPEASTDDSELRLDRTPTDLHSMRLADPVLHEFASRIQAAAVDAAVADFQCADAARAAALSGQRILVTGSAGYVGAALYRALVGLGAEPVGLDVVPGATVDIEADISDLEAVRTAMAGCDGVIHTAAMHAPHATHRHETEFVKVNVAGTQNVLDVAAAQGNIPVVHTSTTSLTITKNVKRIEAEGRIVWLDAASQPPIPSSAADDPDDGPRNKYGRTKLEGERRCVAATAAGLPCVIVRISRAYPEDALVDSVTAGQAALSTANLKANELLGRRVALVDVLAGHLRALTRAREPSVRGQVLTLSAPFPWTKEETPDTSEDFFKLLLSKRPALAKTYAALGWSMPCEITRVYDSSLAVALLDWSPKVTFDSLLGVLAADGSGSVGGFDAEDARAGAY